MATGILHNLCIRGIVCALPDNKIDTTSFYQTFEKEAVDKFIKSVGVESTYRCLERQTASDLCFAAAKELINRIEWGDDIDILLFCSHSPDYPRPATACVLQGRLGLKKDCMAFDVGMGCSAFVYGMSVIGSIMQSVDIKRGMLLLGGGTTRTKDPEDTDNMIFGDCGAAVAFERSDVGKDIHYLLQTDGTRYKNLMIVGGGARHMDYPYRYTYMNGTNIFAFTISDVVNTINKFIERYHVNLEEVDMVALHQANLMIMKSIAKKCHFNMEKMPIVIDRYGNTTESSIPLIIADSLLKSGNRKEAYHIIASGYGIGLSWGVVEFVLDGNIEVGILYTNDYFDDGYYEDIV